VKTTLFSSDVFDTAIYCVSQKLQKFIRSRKKDKEFTLNSQNYNAETALKSLGRK